MTLLSSLPAQIHLIEVGPRDGLQSISDTISVDDKVEFIRLLSETGLTEIEAGAFVSPKWVQQMAGSAEVFERLKKFPSNVTYSALVPNEKGFEAALKAGVKKVAVFTAASETFNQKNINCGIQESIDRFVPVVKAAQQHGIAVRGYVSTAFVCPYEGPIAPQACADVVSRLRDLGIADISIGDTVGRATPGMVRSVLELLVGKTPASSNELAMHFHDTEGRALKNIYESLKFFITRFDASAGGLGGCPYAPGASGNVATNDVVALCESLDIATGIDLAKLNLAAQFMENILQRPLNSRVLRGEKIEATDFV